MWELRGGWGVGEGIAVIDKPQKVEIQKIGRMVALIWPGDLMLMIKTRVRH